MQTLNDISFTKRTYLQENVCTIVNNENQRANTMQVTDPTERNKSNCYDVMDEHLPKVFATHIEELRCS